MCAPIRNQVDFFGGNKKILLKNFHNIRKLFENMEMAPQSLVEWRSKSLRVRQWAWHRKDRESPEAISKKPKFNLSALYNASRHAGTPESRPQADALEATAASKALRRMLEVRSSNRQVVDAAGWQAPNEERTTLSSLEKDCGPLQKRGLATSWLKRWGFSWRGDYLHSKKINQLSKRI